MWAHTSDRLFCAQVSICLYRALISKFDGADRNCNIIKASISRGQSGFRTVTTSPFPLLHRVAHLDFELFLHHYQYNSCYTLRLTLILVFLRIKLSCTLSPLPPANNHCLQPMPENWPPKVQRQRDGVAVKWDIIFTPRSSRDDLPLDRCLCLTLTSEDPFCWVDG